MRHSGGRASLVYSEHPYDTIRTAVAFKYGDTIQHLAISQSGRFLAATLHQSTGRQAIVVSDVEQMKETGRFSYQVIAAEGSPEFPSWSPDETTLYWSAYTNGVSNVYRYRSDEGTVEVPWCTTPIEAESSLGPDSHHPIISLSGIPSAVMVLRILHPILASTLCAANPLARIAEPTIAL